MEFPKTMGQTADQTVQMYGPATVYTSATAFIPLSLYFPTLVPSGVVYILLDGPGRGWKYMEVAGQGMRGAFYQMPKQFVL